jgi:anhydro-N-acetylmuramic acid kinase
MDNQIIGLMSGTSLDGLDIACCEFVLREDNRYKFAILAAETIPYDQGWKQRLSTLENGSAFEYVKAHADLGRYFGEQVLHFIQEKRLHPCLIASHGHTIFHQPQLGFSSQIGDGNAIAAMTHLPVAYDFRSLDVALQGQGAPLVPIGDELLFADYAFCLNLGGISNISYQEGGVRKAYDISLCNIPLNHLARQLGLEYDKDGEIARRGNVDPLLLAKMNEQEYFGQDGPKSLGKEWFIELFLPLLEQSHASVSDKLRTVVEHIAVQIAGAMADMLKGKVLITGGGALNLFLIERIGQLTHHTLYVPDKQLVNYKEALVFAFLGLLRMKKAVNCLASVTGASKNSCGGCLAGLPM